MPDRGSIPANLVGWPDGDCISAYERTDSLRFAYNQQKH